MLYPVFLEKHKPLNAKDDAKQRVILRGAWLMYKTFSHNWNVAANCASVESDHQGVKNRAGLNLRIMKITLAHSRYQEHRQTLKFPAADWYQCEYPVAERPYQYHARSLNGACDQPHQHEN